MDWKLIDIMVNSSYPKEEEPVVFYSKYTNCLYIGQFVKSKFVGYCSAANPSDEEIQHTFRRCDVTAYIRISDYKEEEWKSIKEVQKTAPNGLFLLSRTKTQNGDYLYGIEEDKVKSETVDMEAVVIPELPECVARNFRKMGRYKWELVDVRNGLYTYNIFKRTWYGVWRLYGNEVAETTTQREGMRIADSLLKNAYDNGK